jgi:hypothetical protein
MKMGVFDTPGQLRLTLLLLCGRTRRLRHGTNLAPLAFELVRYVLGNDRLIAVNGLRHAVLRRRIE